MAEIPEPIHSITALIDQHHQTRQTPPRPHMGISTLGQKCDRKLWLAFRWAVQPKFPGRVLRVFRRGHMEEATIMHDLKVIGIRFAEMSRQHEVKFGAHVSGSLDAIIERGVPGAEKTRHVAEFKTHNAKSFADLVKHGVEKSKPEHFAQMQVYMLGTEIDRALYVAVCKDNDEIYTERVELNREFAERAVERGKRIALADRMPEPISADPSWFACKFCDAHAFCHDKQPTKHVNCRTCAHSTAMEDSTWRCERHDADDIPLDFQRKGCDDHVLHPDLVPWRMEPHGDDGKSVVYWIENNPVVNGPDGRTSREILENPVKCAVDSITIEILRNFPKAG
ncbi:MAG: oxidoreductase [Burkholderiales bacterium]